MYGYKHRLSFLFNAKSPTNGHIRYSFVSNTTQQKFLPPINVSRGDYANYRNYDMLAAHMRYNRTVLDWYMKPDCKFISIIREPAAQFESAFEFFKMPHKMAQRDYEMHLHLPPRGNAIDRWLSNPEPYLKGLGGPKSTVWVSLNNGQILDLGLHADDINNISAVMRTVQNLSQELDLVLITEYFDESLILLKKLLCWTYEDIVYLSQNQRHVRRRIREGTKHNIRKWNHADVILYQHFNKTLWRKIDEYGPSFQTDLATFRKIKDKITKECLVQSDMHLDHKGIVRYRTNEFYETRCKLLTDNKELFYQIWKRQSSGFLANHRGGHRRNNPEIAHQIAIRRHRMARDRNLPWPGRARMRSGYSWPPPRQH